MVRWLLLSANCYNSRFLSSIINAILDKCFNSAHISLRNLITSGFGSKFLSLFQFYSTYNIKDLAKGNFGEICLCNFLIKVFSDFCVVAAKREASITKFYLISVSIIHYLD